MVGHDGDCTSSVSRSLMPLVWFVACALGTFSVVELQGRVEVDN